MANKTTNTIVLNELAYLLADTDLALDLAQDLALRAITQLEVDGSAVNLSMLEDKDLHNVTSLAAAWDSLGWIYYKQNDLAKAQKYVEAAWQLSQHAEVANHLGDIYTKRGRRADAIHMWRLALAVDNHDKTAQERLRLADAPLTEPRVPTKTGQDNHVSPEQELGQLRTTNVTKLLLKEGSAEFYLLVSKGKVEEEDDIYSSCRRPVALHHRRQVQRLFQKYSPKSSRPLDRHSPAGY